MPRAGNRTDAPPSPACAQAKLFRQFLRRAHCWTGGLIVLMGVSLLAKSEPPDEQSPFVELTAESGIEFVHQRGASLMKYLVETQGSGCALLDYDQDGLLDIFLVDGGLTPDSPPVTSQGHRLYRNLGNWKFKDATAGSGIRSTRSYGMGVAVGDYDNDGYPDVYITNFGSNNLYHNNGDGTFSDLAEQAGVQAGGWSTSAAFLDFDRDGLLDLYVVRYLDYHYERPLYCAEKNLRSYCHPRNFAGAADKLYRNLGSGRFRDVSETSGIANPEGKGLGVVAADFDGDGWIDLYVANDTTRNFLYRNNKNGTFSDVTLTSGTGYSPEGQAEAGMGTDAADYDGDGRLDIVVTNYDLETNGLYRNEGDWLFSDERWPAGLAKTDRFLLGFGTAFFDFDNDGDQDLLIVNGHVLDNAEQVRDEIRYAQPIQLLENRQGRFSENLSFASYASKSPRVGRGASLGDVDNDGDVDILVSNSGQKPVLLMNQIPSTNNWLLLKLVGTHCNRDAVGTTIVVTSHTDRQVTQIRGGGSYLSASDIRVHFGLGSSKTAEELKIRWPCGSEEVFREIKANQILTIKESGSRSQLLCLQPKKT